MDLKNINLMNDALFKAFMTHENNRTLVVDFLHSVTGIEKEVLRSGTFIGGVEIPKRKEYNKKQMTDMSIFLENKRRIIVEMNQYSTKNLFYKNTSYAFSILIEGSIENMKEYPRVILINIDNFNRFKTDKPILNFKIRDEEGNIETEMYESIHLILANMNNPKYNINKEIKKFSEFLKKTDLEEVGKEYERDERYMAAIRTVEDLTTDPNLIGYYDYEKERERELREEKEYAREEGLKEGFEEGLKKGIEQGVEQGVEQANMEIAKTLLTKGFSSEEVAEYTNLTQEEIQKLKEN